jgi:hypothetical protein
MSLCYPIFGFVQGANDLHRMSRIYEFNECFLIVDADEVRKSCNKREFIKDSFAMDLI